MGLSIYRVGSKFIGVKVTCDNDHGLLKSPTALFKERPSIFTIDQAYKAGWSNTFRNGERLWLCPDCASTRRKG